ncbi:MAG: twin-arginine translocase subunit TatC, partial [Muribaculaceae bacterium]|nr:twin-arginine translocase subunit TatC [Muribaculaceae bacterium]
MEENKTPAHKSDDMNFWGHLDELRSVLVRIAVVVIVFGVVFFIFMPWIFDNVFLEPCRASFQLYKLFDMIAPE